MLTQQTENPTFALPASSFFCLSSSSITVVPVAKTRRKLLHTKYLLLKSRSEQVNISFWASNWLPGDFQSPLLGAVSLLVVRRHVFHVNMRLNYDDVVKVHSWPRPLAFQQWCLHCAVKNVGIFKHLIVQPFPFSPFYHWLSKL